MNVQNRAAGERNDYSMSLLSVLQCLSQVAVLGIVELPPLDSQTPRTINPLDADIAKPNSEQQRGLAMQKCALSFVMRECRA